MCARMCVCAWVSFCVYVCVCVCPCVCVCMFMCSCMHVCVCVCLCSMKVVARQLDKFGVPRNDMTELAARDLWLQLLPVMLCLAAWLVTILHCYMAHLGLATLSRLIALLFSWYVFLSLVTIFLYPTFVCLRERKRERVFSVFLSPTLCVCLKEKDREEGEGGSECMTECVCVCVCVPYSTAAQRTWVCQHSFVL